MKAFTLVRLTDTGRATFGQLFDDEGKQVCCTLELPWQNNAHDVSCIPEGTYTAHRRFSPKHNCEVFELADVPDRGNIEMHIGNFAHDSLGCILLGAKFAVVNGQNAIADSRVAFGAFMRSLTGVGTITLTIRQQPPLAA